MRPWSSRRSRCCQEILQPKQVDIVDELRFLSSNNRQPHPSTVFDSTALTAALPCSWPSQWIQASNHFHKEEDFFRTISWMRLERWSLHWSVQPQWRWLSGNQHVWNFNHYYCLHQLSSHCVINSIDAIGQGKQFDEILPRLCLQAGARAQF